MSDPVKVHLSPDDARFAAALVAAGKYSTLEEAAKAAFRMLREEQTRSDAVRDELQALFAEMDAGVGQEVSNEDFAELVRRAARSGG
ncbi:MAG: type II toxin-antitoxin system ParD family antitoxin [Polyangiaceae bacterium]|nr:type II toxin-antitoxin system ParD family antitoxin [Myxococcales bacterium]MCB9584509.1 type II toxin-antitoxin system ParD family antitoxin [Polyangiaceae bacterium]MCB9609353.1 type II toxin-antitoxin system ParD family antitoxin [Polyangiaceae bacterium]